MQQLQNSDLRKFPSEKKKGLTGAIIIHLILLLVLIFIGFKIPPPPEFEEGILVNFGTDETGYGLVEPAPFVTATSTPLPVAPISSVEEPLLTQDDEEAPEVRKVDPDAERRRVEQAAEAARRREEALEAERRRQEEETERRRIEAEQQRQAEIMRNTRDALAGARTASANSPSEGVAGGAGNQGSPTGSPNSSARGEGTGAGNSGVSYDLGGRGSVGALPMPTYNYQEEGIVVVRINVDRAGTVTQATPGVTGSTTLNENLLKIATEAALKARFAPAPNAPATQVGTITYNFILR